MSVELCDSTGSLGQAATNTGFSDARAASDKKKSPALQKLFNDGYTKNPSQASKEALKLAHKVDDNQVRNTLVNLSRLLSQAKDFAVVQ